jgi:hypothetical protein
MPGRWSRGLGGRGLCALVLLLWAQEGGAQTTLLRGELLLRDGQPAVGVRLVVVGHPPELAIQDNGMFSHVLSGAPSEVTVRVVGSEGTEVLFPPGGRVVVPADPDAVISVLVGERIEVAVEDRIERDLAALRETLEVRGVSQEEIEAVLRSELDGLVSRIAALTEGAVESAVAGAAQADLRERVNRYLGTYVRRARDLVDAFGLVDVSGPLPTYQFLILRDAIGNYSDAYGELDRELSEMPAALMRAWPGEAGVGLSDRMEGVLTRIRTGLHREMLDLRGPLTDIQLDYTPDRPSAEAVRRARAAVAEAVPRVEEAVVGLEVVFPEFMEALRDAPAP